MSGSQLLPRMACFTCHAAKTAYARGNPTVTHSGMPEDLSYIRDAIVLLTADTLEDSTELLEKVMVDDGLLQRNAEGRLVAHSSVFGLLTVCRLLLENLVEESGESAEFWLEEIPRQVRTWESGE